MSKVTQEAFTRRPPSDGTPQGAEASARPRDLRELDDVTDLAQPEDADDGPDLKATVTLSGEALAALLEEVKNAQRTATEQAANPLAATPHAASPIDGEADSPSRRGPQRSAGKT
jgi:hypothetical protein